MRYSRTRLLSTAAAIPLMMGVVVSVGAVVTTTADNGSAVAACNPCAAKKPSACNPCNPCAATKASACNPCNPCAATKTSACNPCNPCAASACNPCNPCGPGGGLAVPDQCFVPRLQAAACNPCAAKKASACNPCNPCAATKTSACNPCNPCAATKTSACNPCNPCAATKASACSPCNPCAAANPCNPCSPCAAAAPVELTDAEAAAAYDCLYPEIRAAYADTGFPATKDWKSWAAKFSRQPYPSATHGGRLVSNYANGVAKAEYGKFEDVKQMPKGSVLIKDSFSATPAGGLAVGPLFLMEKMDKGFNPDTGDWRYIMFTPDGKLFGMTKGENAAGMGFCHECHAASEDTDYLFFLPDEYRG